jgi:hypothetical protein
MTDRSPVTTLDAVHAAILAAARTRFGSLIAQYGAYEPWDEEVEPEAPLASVQTPALLLEIEGLARADTDALGRFGVDATCVLHCVLSLSTPRLQQTLPQFAAAVLALVDESVTGTSYLRGNDWKLGGAASYPTNLQAQPAAFTPGLNGRDAWLVRWDQTFYLSTELPLVEPPEPAP